MFPPTVVMRHKRENLKKCSLRGLESRPDFRFIDYPYAALPDLNGYLLLTLNAPLLTAADAASGMLILDATWRLAGKMLKSLEHHPGLLARSLPNHYRTAYPRRQQDCPDPIRGLASIEAIYICYHLLNRPVTGLLEHYYWREPFLQLNSF